MNPVRPFGLALQFLTRIPVPTMSTATPSELGHSVVFYPLVGLILGLVLAALHAAMANVSDLLRASLVLLAWVALTGALHLDGLGDSADAWIGGLGSRERTLAIMKDPHCGPAAVVALILVLLVKFAALAALTLDDWLVLALVPVLARATVPVLFLTTPYVRAGGIGVVQATMLPKIAARIVPALAALATLAIAGTLGVWLLLTAAGVFALSRWTMMRRLGGTTGDTTGALIELSETAMLVGIALAQA
jgi:adenosylcobinamide-GDP ribazoletransferase